MYTGPFMQNDQTYDRERKNLTEAEEEVIKDEDKNDNDDGTS